MAAILGDTAAPDRRRSATRRSEAGDVVPANYNAPEQLVVSGEVAGVESAMELAKAAGAKRAIRLSVSGAFHSPLMEPAAAGLKAALDAAQIAATRLPGLFERDRRAVRGTGRRADAAAHAAHAPVRWVRDHAARWPRAYPDALFVEMGPGSVLTGLLKRIVPEQPGDDVRHGRRRRRPPRAGVIVKIDLTGLSRSSREARAASAARSPRRSRRAGAAWPSSGATRACGRRGRRGDRAARADSRAMSPTPPACRARRGASRNDFGASTFS